ncbi:MAG: hypothetical protein A2406_01265 [Candidatus Komeilibacteria bacterium RIFOXYC1_FULL_37_11]|uniref:Uncharacterized protein n=1 Tax=Candidatus Komeilibacteria bacterium RIFOXYC1_FULL_37_11 TaxID=1798555 RepID=A0A1G2C2A4_9BACT|nr:MAG: hypothetical protein A2406_01265 [Candidatus Komeilibacteria bacterium RIFOXYC1_FULL_37_11]OGY95674.1 MAG: hypothetical protein A2611_02740 [Candidatus Komeilibacteria bacterium RIFOXYD1_FULL_37_29]
MRRALWVLSFSILIVTGIIIACQDGSVPTAMSTQTNDTPTMLGAATSFVAGASYSDSHRNAIFIPRNETDSGGVYAFDIRIDGSHQFQAEISLAAFIVFSEALDLQQIADVGTPKETTFPVNTRAIPGTIWKHRTLDAWIIIEDVEGDVYTCDIRINGSSQLLPVKVSVQALQQTLSIAFFTDLLSERSIQ